MHLNVGQREIILKVVYYGPPLSGKTTNLQALHRLLAPSICGRLTTLDTADDRTLFFDLLPVVLTASSGYRVKLKLYTVPGQVIHAATRRLVLAGADGVVFVADSQTSEARINNEYWHGMRSYLDETGIDPDGIPTVIQFNKRDLPNVRSDQEIETMRAHSPEPLFLAVATTGAGVLETLTGLLLLMFENFEERYDFADKFKLSGRDFVDAIHAQVRAVGSGEAP